MLLDEKGLSFERLNSLAEVLRHDGLAAAAPGDVIRQNQIGRQIRELEAFFKCKLTQRTGKTVALSAEGIRLGALAREILDRLDDFKRSVTHARRKFKIAAGGSLYSELVAPRLARLKNLGLELHLDELFHEEMLEALHHGDVDVAVSWGGMPSTAGLKMVTLGNYEYALFGAKHLIGKRRSLDAVFQLPAAVVVHRDITHEIKLHLATDEVVYVDEYIAALRLVASGAFTAILPRLHMQYLPLKEFTMIELPFLRTYTRKVTLYWNPRVAERRGFTPRWIEEIAQVFRVD